MQVMHFDFVASRGGTLSGTTAFSDWDSIFEYATDEVRGYVMSCVPGNFDGHILTVFIQHVLGNAESDLVELRLIEADGDHHDLDGSGEYHEAHGTLADVVLMGTEKVAR